jgi:hypothetical protein
MSLTKLTGAFFFVLAVNAANAKERVINIFPEDNTPQEVDSNTKLNVKLKSEDDSNFLWGLFSAGEKANTTIIKDDLNSQEVKVLDNTYDMSVIESEKNILSDAALSIEPIDEVIEKILSKTRMLPQYDYFEHKAIEDMSSRMFIDQDSKQINFLVKKGYLRASIEALMKETRNTKSLVWRVGAHKVYGDYWVQGDSMEAVFNSMFKPYRKPEQVMGGTFLGNTIGVFYNNDPEFMQ